MLQRIEDVPLEVQRLRGFVNVHHLAGIVKPHAQMGVFVGQARDFRAKGVMCRTAVVEELDCLGALHLAHPPAGYVEAIGFPGEKVAEIALAEWCIRAQCIDLIGPAVLRVRQTEPVVVAEAAKVLGRHVEKEHDFVSLREEHAGRVVQQDAATAPRGRMNLVGNEANPRHGRDFFDL